MAKSKVPEMPIVPPQDGEIELNNAYTRLNPKGDKELVIKRLGKHDEETLNELDELADNLMGLLEGIEFSGQPSLSAEQPNIQRNTPQLAASKGDQLRSAGETLTNMYVNSATSEHGVGIGPTPADSPDLSRAKSPLRSTPLSNNNDGLDRGATYSEDIIKSIAELIE